MQLENLLDLVHNNYAIAIGYLAGANGQGGYSIAIGNNAGYNYQSQYSICINATGQQISPPAPGLYISPIAQDTTAPLIMYYNSSTYQVSWGALNNITQQVDITDNSNTTSTTTGALTVAGSIGVGGNLNIGGITKFGVYTTATLKTTTGYLGDVVVAKDTSKLAYWNTVTTRWSYVADDSAVTF